MRSQMTPDCAETALSVNSTTTFATRRYRAMKKSIAAALFRSSIGLVLVLMAAGCGFSGFGPSVQSAATGSLNLTIMTDTASRTIAPATVDFPAVAKYRVVMSRTGYSTLAQTFTTSPCSVTGLEAGSWTVTVEGLTSADAKVASGTTTTTIAASGTNSASVSLAYLLADVGKPGSAAITLEFPHSAGIDSVIGSLEGTALTLTVAAKDATTDTVVYSASSVVIGNPRLLITLKKGSIALMHWTERLFVYQGMATAKTVTLAVTDFASAPVAPTSFTATASSDGITLLWTNVAVAETYAITQSSGGAAYSDLAGATAIAAGTTTYKDTSAVAGTAYTYKIVAKNGYGSSTAATSSSATVPTFNETAFNTDVNSVYYGGYNIISEKIYGDFYVSPATTTSKGNTVTWTITSTDATKPMPTGTYKFGTETGTSRTVTWVQPDVAADIPVRLTATVTDGTHTGTKNFDITALRVSNRLWTDVAASDDGTYILGARNSGSSTGTFYSSNDSGTTIKIQGRGNSCVAVGMDKTGQYQAALEISNEKNSEGNLQDKAYVWISENFGATWTLADPWPTVPATFKDMFVSPEKQTASGKPLIALVEAGLRMVSLDFGATWPADHKVQDVDANSTRWNRIKGSGDGKILLVRRIDGTGYKVQGLSRSNDYGVTWTTMVTPDSVFTSAVKIGIDYWWNNMAISRDGLTIVLTASTYLAQNSTDSGSTWNASNLSWACTPNYPVDPQWANCIEVSPDGSFFVIGDHSGKYGLMSLSLSTTGNPGLRWAPIWADSTKDFPEGTPKVFSLAITGVSTPTGVVAVSSNPSDGSGGKLYSFGIKDNLVQGTGKKILY
ncbi:MAG: hypothetical protein WCQ50_20500 [Spirochaetota bacterium]